MTKILLFFCGICFSLISLQAQTLKGVITDTEGKPVSFATVYIREITSGIVTDEQGTFLSHLKKGNYTGEFAALGYEKKVLPFTITDKETTLHVTLEEKAYSLREVIVNADDEDPAYAIMRKAIAHAPFYRYQVKTYLADIYIKGTLKTGKLPSFGSVIIGDKESKVKAFSNKLFLVESQNEVKFTAPNTYDQKVVALSTTIPGELNGDEAINVITNNVYDPELFGIVSPLSSGAFSYYKFVLEGISTEGHHVINKIKVIPKKKNMQLMSGWLYILDRTWNIQHLDITFNQMGLIFHNNVSFHEVKPDVWLPTGYDLNVKFNMLGIKFTGRYYSSVKYKEIEVNEMQVSSTPSLAEPVIKEKLLSKKEQKALKQLEELAAKDKLTTRDAYKMAQLMEEKNETPEIKEEKKSLEIRSSDSTVHITRDSLALLRDSTYWNKIRTQPLRVDEILSYKQKDSLKDIWGSKKDTLNRRTSKKWIASLLLGKKIKPNKQATFTYGGLLKAFPEYNFTDGLWLGQQFSADIDFPQKKSLTFKPAVYYTTARKEIIWQTDAIFRYDPFRHGELVLSAGDISEDYAGKEGTNRLVNAFASLLFAENTAKFYRKKYAGISHRIDIANGLRLTASLEYEKRYALRDNTSYSVFGRSPHSNLPHGYTSAPMPDHTAYITDLKIEYTPRYHYRIRKGEKFYEHSRYPTFTLRYRQGLPLGKAPNTSFKMISAGLKQTVRLNLFNDLSYGIDAGFFPERKRLYLPDFKHFGTGESYVTDHSLETCFCLLDNYRHATNDRWLQIHATLFSEYLFLKHLIFMQNYLFDEALHIRTLWLPGTNYTEAGYSIGLSQAARIGVFTGFRDGRYDAVGFSVSLPLLKLLKQ